MLYLNLKIDLLLQNTEADSVNFAELKIIGYLNWFEFLIHPIWTTHTGGSTPEIEVMRMRIISYQYKELHNYCP